MSSSIPLDPNYYQAIANASNDFNTAYAQYLSCNCMQPGIGASTSACTTDPLLGCPTTNIGLSWQTMVYPSYVILQNTIDQALATIQPINLPNYDASMNELTTQYTQLLAFRQNLDQHVKDLHLNYTTNTGIPNMYQSKLDTTILTTSIWAILATSLAIYIFMKHE